MEKTIILFRLVHRVTLIILLVLIAIVPLITSIDETMAFVILPTFLIFVFTLSILIEQKLDRLTLVKTKAKKTTTCLLKKCFHKNCLS